MAIHSEGVVEGIIAGLIVLPIGGLAALSFQHLWKSMRWRSKQARQKALQDLESPDFIQKSQRNAFRWMAMAVYWLGGYLFFSITLRPAKLVLALHFLSAAAILLCSGMAAASAAGMNEYGVRRLREAYAREIVKEERKAARKRELDDLR